MSELESKARCQRWLEAHVGRLVGGQVVAGSDDDELELRASLDGRPLRVIVDWDTGWIRIEAKLQNTVGVLVVQWERGKQPREPWSETEQACVLLAPDVFIEEYAAEASAMVALAGALPAPLRAEIVAAMPGNFSELRIDATVIEVRFEETMKTLASPSALFASLFHLLVRLATHFESGQETVTAKPRLYVRGQPVNAGIGSLTCPFCRTLIREVTASHCPHCGAPIQK